MADYAAQRETMVASQLRPNRVTSPDVLRVFSKTPREAYLPSPLKSLAYMDDHLALSPGFPDAPGRYCLSPMTQAWLLQAARVSKADAALDVGAGAGCSAALLAGLAGRVDALEESDSLAKFAEDALAAESISNVAIRRGPLTGADLAGGPYDVIIVNGAVPRPPESLLALLALNGRLACILAKPDENRVMVFEKVKTGVRQSVIWDASAPPLKAFSEKIGFIF